MVTAYGTIELAVDAMKLGATDFVRKPMIPDTVRNAVAAALAKREGGIASASVKGGFKRGASPGQPGDQLPHETWTTNGFFFRASGRPAATWQPAEHRFTVRRGTDVTESEVVVTHRLGRGGPGFQGMRPCAEPGGSILAATGGNSLAQLSLERGTASRRGPPGGRSNHRHHARDRVRVGRGLTDEAADVTKGREKEPQFNSLAMRPSDRFARLCAREYTRRAPRRPAAALLSR